MVFPMIKYKNTIPPNQLKRRIRTKQKQKQHHVLYIISLPPTDRIGLELLNGNRLIGQSTRFSQRQPPPLTSLTSPTQNAHNDSRSAQTIIIRRNRIRNPRRISISINNTDGRHIIQPALMQQRNILHGIQADDQIRLHSRPPLEVFLELRQLGVVSVHHLRLAPAQDLLSVRQTPGDPPLEDVVAPGQLGRADNGPLLALFRADEEEEAAAGCYLFDDLRCAAEVGCRHVEGDDVDAVADTEDIPRVQRVPSGCGMAEVSLGGEE